MNAERVLLLLLLIRWTGAVWVAVLILPIVGMFKPLNPRGIWMFIWLLLAAAAIALLIFDTALGVQIWRDNAIQS